MLLKILLIVAIAAIIYFVFFKKKPLSKDGSNDKSEASEMVECSACGTYTQIEDTIISNNKYYCSKECVDKA